MNSLYVLHGYMLRYYEKIFLKFWPNTPVNALNENLYIKSDTYHVDPAKGRNYLSK